MVLLLADVVAYFRDEQWHAQLRKDLPIGTPLENIRVYLKDEGQQHGIEGLWEDDRPDYPGFVFRNHNHSIITRSLIEGNIDYVLLMGGVRINLDADGNLKEISLPSHRCINRKEFPLPPADLLAFSVYFLAGKKVCLPAVSAQPLEIVRIWRDAIPQGVRRNV